MLQHLREQRKTHSVIYPDFKGGEYEFGVIANSFDALIRCAKQRPFTVRVPLTNKETRLEHFNWIAEFALEVSSRDKLPTILAVDEAQRVSSKNKNADGFELVQENGGMFGLDLIFTTHRPSDVHGSLRAACDRVIIFQTHHSADIKVFQENIDVPENAFKSLKKDDYLEWHVQHGYRVVRKGIDDSWQNPYSETAAT